MPGFFVMEIILLVFDGAPKIDCIGQKDGFCLKFVGYRKERNGAGRVDGNRLASRGQQHEQFVLVVFCFDLI